MKWPPFLAFSPVSIHHNHQKNFHLHDHEPLPAIEQHAEAVAATGVAAANDQQYGMPQRSVTTTGFSSARANSTTTILPLASEKLNDIIVSARGVPPLSPTSPTSHTRPDSGYGESNGGRGGNGDEDYAGSYAGEGAILRALAVKREQLEEEIAAFRLTKERELASYERELRRKFAFERTRDSRVLLGKGTGITNKPGDAATRRNGERTQQQQARSSDDEKSSSSSAADTPVDDREGEFGALFAPAYLPLLEDHPQRGRRKKPTGATATIDTPTRTQSAPEIPTSVPSASETDMLFLPSTKYQPEKELEGRDTSSRTSAGLSRSAPYRRSSSAPTISPSLPSASPSIVEQQEKEQQQARRRRFLKSTPPPSNSSSPTRYARIRSSQRNTGSTATADQDSYFSPRSSSAPSPLQHSSIVSPYSSSGSNGSNGANGVLRSSLRQPRSPDQPPTPAKDKKHVLFRIGDALISPSSSPVITGLEYGSEEEEDDYDISEDEEEYEEEDSEDLDEDSDISDEEFDEGDNDETDSELDHSDASDSDSDSALQIAPSSSQKCLPNFSPSAFASDSPISVSNSTSATETTVAATKFALPDIPEDPAEQRNFHRSDSESSSLALHFENQPSSPRSNDYGYWSSDAYLDQFDAEYSRPAVATPPSSYTTKRSSLLLQDLDGGGANRTGAHADLVEPTGDVPVISQNEEVDFKGNEGGDPLFEFFDDDEKRLAAGNGASAGDDGGPDGEEDGIGAADEGIARGLKAARGSDWGGRRKKASGDRKKGKAGTEIETRSVDDNAGGEWTDDDDGFGEEREGRLMPRGVQSPHVGSLPIEIKWPGRR